jgi:hypothetical protein
LVLAMAGPAAARRIQQWQVLAMARGAWGKSFDDGRRSRVDRWEWWQQEARQGGVLMMLGKGESAGGSNVQRWSGIVRWERRSAEVGKWRRSGGAASRARHRPPPRVHSPGTPPLPSLSLGYTIGLLRA